MLPERDIHIIKPTRASSNSSLKLSGCSLSTSTGPCEEGTYRTLMETRTVCINRYKARKKKSREANCIFKSYFKVLHIETSTSLGSLQKYEVDKGEFKGAQGSRVQLILSPGVPGRIPTIAGILARNYLHIVHIHQQVTARRVL